MVNSPTLLAESCVGSQNDAAAAAKTESESGVLMMRFVTVPEAEEGGLNHIVKVAFGLTKTELAEVTEVRKYSFHSHYDWFLGEGVVGDSGHGRSPALLLSEEAEVGQAGEHVIAAGGFARPEVVDAIQRAAL